MVSIPSINMSLFGTPSSIVRAALGRVSKEGEREKEVRDEAPAEEENVGRNATDFEEPAPGDSSLSRILNHVRFDMDN